MYSRLESYPVTTTHPADPQHKILHPPLIKSAVLSSQAPIQATFPRPTLFIPSSRSSSNSSASGSSPEFSTEDVNQYPISATKFSTMSSRQQPSSSYRALLQGRPLPQVPPLPMPPAPIQLPTNNPLNNASIPNPSPITSPSSPTALQRPKRALPIIPPSPRTPQMTGHSYLSTSPATPSVGSSDVHTPSPQSSSSVEPFSKLHVSLSIDLSPTAAVIHRLPYLRQQPQTRIAARRVNAEASSSKVQLPPRTPVSLDDLISPLPPPRPKLKVPTPPLTRAPTDHSHRESQSNDRPKLRIQTPSLVEPDSAPFNRTRHQLPQKVHPLPRVPIQIESGGRVSSLARRSSLDSLTTRSSALLSPGQALSPYVSKRPRSRRFSRSPQQYSSLNVFSEGGSLGAPGLGVTGTRTADRDSRDLADEDGLEEPISPMKFTRDDPDGEHDGGGHGYGWDGANPGRGSRSVVESRTYFSATVPFASFYLNFTLSLLVANQNQGVLVLSNPAILNSTADEVIDKRLDRIRRRHGETVIREFGVDPRVSLEKDKGKGRAHGVGRFILSEGEEGETDDEDDFYQPSPRLRHGVFGDYQDYISDYGYGYGHEQAQEIQGQPQVYGNPHFVGNAYEHHRMAVEDDIEDEDSDPDSLGDADNKTPAAMFPPRPVPGMFEIEDEMVFERPAAIFDDLDDDEDEYLYREKRVVANPSSVMSNEPISSDSDLALGGYVTVKRGGSSRGTPPPSSRETTSRKFMKHIPRLSGTTHSQSSEKFGNMHSASSSSSSFITPPPSSFQDQGFQQAQNAGAALSIKKHFGRRWFKEKSGQKWEQRDYEEVIGSLKKSV
ncbi:hypothetical protein BDM02DRAFT_3182847 [Thelephora ganbajun]|uniref:Uncharacterized protein n=1 Tax=Thelephora ganbajun TaxID=370292 RepID=A0ACB6ZU30_THEGA|nr:hypothetical protein BDM02DRAFT_3182847 [Thelephora ganbajun]